MSSYLSINEKPAENSKDKNSLRGRGWKEKKETVILGQEQ